MLKSLQSRKIAGALPANPALVLMVLVTATAVSSISNYGLADAPRATVILVHEARLRAAQAAYNAALGKLSNARAGLVLAENRIAERQRAGNEAKANSEIATADLKEAELRIAESQTENSEYQTAKRLLDRARERKKISYDLAFQNDAYLLAAKKIKQSVDPGLAISELRRKTLRDNADYQRTLNELRQGEFRFNAIWNSLCAADAQWSDAATRAREARVEEKRIIDKYGDLIFQRNFARSEIIQASADVARADAALKSLRARGPSRVGSVVTNKGNGKGKGSSRRKRKR